MLNILLVIIMIVHNDYEHKVFTYYILHYKNTSESKMLVSGSILGQLELELLFIGAQTKDDKGRGGGIGNGSPRK